MEREIAIRIYTGKLKTEANLKIEIISISLHLVKKKISMDY